MRLIKKSIIGAVLCLTFFFSMTVTAYAEPTCPSSQLTVRVGYFGGPYYEKAVYSVADLEAIGTQSCLYTCMDSGGFLRYAEAEGVYLCDIMEDAGIDINSINKCHFGTYDAYIGGTEYFKSLGCNTLFWSERYSFPDLAQYWNRLDQSLTQEESDAIWDTAQSVQSMLSLRDNFKRVADETPYHTGDNGEKTSEDSFRLLFGQTQPLCINDIAGDAANGASNMAKWVYEIDVELGGTPSLSINDEQLELKVGSDYRVTVTVNSGDAAISQEIMNNLQWESSDPSVVSSDNSGQLTAHGQGEATITVYDPHYDDLRATLHIVVGEAENLAGGETGDDNTPVDNKEEQTNGDTEQPGIDGNGKKPSDVKTNQPPDNTEKKVADTPKYVTKATKIPPTELAEKVHSIRVNRVTIDSDTGGVQNWREHNMAEDASALGLLAEDNPLSVVAEVAAAGFLICGGILMYIRFKKETKEVKTDD